MQTAQLSTDNHHVYLHCEICEDHEDLDISFSFSWEHEIADNISETITHMMELHNINHHEGNVTCSLEHKPNTKSSTT